MDFLANINNQSNIAETPNGIINKNMGQQNNIYQQSNLKNAINAEQQIVASAHEKSKNAIESGVVPRGFNQSILNHTSQFENYQNQEQESDGFVYSKLTGQKMATEHFTHQNMVPFFGSNIKQNMTEESNQTV